jgi:hypothetical protein
LFLIFLVLAAKTERRGEKSWTGLKKRGRGGWGPKEKKKRKNREREREKRVGGNDELPGVLITNGNKSHPTRTHELFLSTYFCIFLF